MDEKKIEMITNMEPERLRAELAAKSTEDLRAIARALAQKLRQKS